MLRIVQLKHDVQGRRVAVVEEPRLRLLQTPSSVYQLAQEACRSSCPLIVCIEQHLSDSLLDYDAVYEDRSAWRLLPPIDHPEPSRCLVTGTGLTHKPSADSRQSMHAAGCAEQTDSMRMYQIGVAGGQPAAGCIGASPEWFYKGVGTILRAPNEPLTVPPHAVDGGEESEIAGVYVISDDGAPWRIGMVQGNEFSDHELEARNYLYLSQSKLRDCAVGPELVINPAFDDVSGMATVERRGCKIWQAEQSSGEQRMCHSRANIEHHHFKHVEHCRPGDLHVHFFGAGIFSYKDRLRLEDGDVMNIAFEGFGRPLRNPIRIGFEEQKLVVAKQL